MLHIQLVEAQPVMRLAQSTLRSPVGVRSGDVHMAVAAVGHDNVFVVMVAIKGTSAPDNGFRHRQVHRTRAWRPWRGVVAKPKALAHSRVIVAAVQATTGFPVKGVERQVPPGHNPNESDCCGAIWRSSNHWMWGIVSKACGKRHQD